MKKAGVIGLGLIGGSIALNLKEQGYTVVGLETDPRAAKFAYDHGIVDIVRGEEELADVSVVFVCTPPKHIRSAVQLAVKITNDQAIVTDVGSIKGNLEGVSGRVVGGHPMAGTERSGIWSARKYLFENAWWALVKMGDASDNDVRFVSELVRSFGARPVLMTADEHDNRVSRVSHLPHLVAYALVEYAIGIDGDSFAGTGFMDSTRIAAADYRFWSEVSMLNRDRLLSDLNGYMVVLDRIRRALTINDRKSLQALMKSAQDKRLNMRLRKVRAGEFSIDVDMKDEVGAVAKLVSLLSVNNIDISGLQIADAREGAGGVLRVFFRSEKMYRQALKILDMDDER